MAVLHNLKTKKYIYKPQLLNYGFNKKLLLINTTRNRKTYAQPNLIPTFKLNKHLSVRFAHAKY